MEDDSAASCSDGGGRSSSPQLLIDESPSTSSKMEGGKMASHGGSSSAVKAKRKGNRITEYIEDKTSRVRSYFRRRHVPFKRAFDLDLQCGTKSLLVQICNDIEECLYYGHDSLVEQFLSQEGLNLSHVNEIMNQDKKTNDRRYSEDEEVSRITSQSSKKKKLNTSRFVAEDDDDDDEYSPTVKEKERRERAKRKEVQQRVQDGDFLANLNERNKVFKSRKDSLVVKIGETDSVCATKSFLLIINLDKEAALYHGDPSLVSQFFTTGISSKQLHTNFNIRSFDHDELEQNNCSVSHCIVTRNTLSRWRLAAIEMFKFPPDLPMTLYLCPEAERERWIAEMDLDPNSTGKIAVCSLHFKEGYPTDEFPLPTELLSEKDTAMGGKVEFRGSKRQPSLSVAKEQEEEELQSDTLPRFTLLKAAKRNDAKKAKLKAALVAKRKRRRWIPSVVPGDKKSAIMKRRAFAVIGRFGSLIQCRFCSKQFQGNKQYFQHVRHHLSLDKLPSASFNEPAAVAKAKEEEPPAIPSATTPTSSKKVKLPPLQVTEEEVSSLLALLYPRPRTKTMNPRKKYVCAVCKSVCDLFGLFLHMKQVHQGMLCCYCTKLFKKVGDLEVHIKKSHRVGRRYYHSSRQFAACAGNKYSFVCSICSDVLSLKDLDRHSCRKTAKKQFDCPYCLRQFQQQSQLDMHLCNGWCKEMSWLKSPSSDKSRKLYKVLTGKDADSSILERVDPSTKLAKVLCDQTNKKLNNALALARSKKPHVFNVADRQVLALYSNLPKSNNDEKQPKKEKEEVLVVLEDVPATGSIYCGSKARGIDLNVRKELRESGYKWDLQKEFDSAVADKSKALSDEVSRLDIVRAGENFFIDSVASEQQHNSSVYSGGPATSAAASNIASSPLSASPQRTLTPVRKPNRRFGPKTLPVHLTQQEAMENKENSYSTDTRKKEEEGISSLKISIPVKKETKAERIARATREIPQNFSKLRKLLDHFENACLFCQQSRVVTVDSVFLLSHLLIIHDRQVVHDFLEEDAQDSLFRIKCYLRDTKSKDVIFSYLHEDDSVVGPPTMMKLMTYNCCYCHDDQSKTYEELFDHLGKAHSSKVLTCHLCQNIFLNYGSFRSHICFGPAAAPNAQLRARFACMVCNRQDLATFLDFQFHVRKLHNTCDICFTDCESQEELYRHCLAHTQELMCMKCFLTYDDQTQFRKHLFYKHDSEHNVCTDCHQKSWPHVYHFCIEQDSNTCEVCDRQFAKLQQYRVHLRTHTGNNPYSCSVKGCKKSYVSKQLLLKHNIRRHPDLRAAAATELEKRRNLKLLEKFNATSIDHIHLVEGLVDDLIKAVIPDEREEGEPQVNGEDRGEEDVLSTPPPPTENEELDPIDAAVASIMGPDGNFDIRKSPVKAPHPPLPAPHAVSRRNLSSSLHTPSFQPLQKVKPTTSVILPPSTAAHIMGNGLAKSPKRSSKGKESSATEDAVSDLDLSSGHDTKVSPVLGGIWNQELMFVSDATKDLEQPKKRSGCKVMKPKYQQGGPDQGIKSLPPQVGRGPKVLDPNDISRRIGSTNEWDVLLSESSGSDNDERRPKKVRIKERVGFDRRVALLDHDYCYASFLASREEEKREDLSEMDKILSNVALGSLDNSYVSDKEKKHKKKKDSKKKKKKKKHKRNSKSAQSSSSDSEPEVDVTTPASSAKLAKKRGPKPKYHTPGSSQGVVAGTARPHFSSSDEEDHTSGDELASSDLDTDFSADELASGTAARGIKRAAKPTPKAAAAAETEKIMAKVGGAVKGEEEEAVDNKPSLKLKIKLPPKPIFTTSTPSSSSAKKRKKSKGRSHQGSGKKSKSHSSVAAKAMSKKMRESLALNRASSTSSSDEVEMSDLEEGGDDVFPPVKNIEVNDKLYCVCQSPHDDVSEMIGCDAPDCRLEWFHFECVGIMVPPEGQWYCPECTRRYNIRSGQL